MKLLPKLVLLLTATLAAWSYGQASSNTISFQGAFNGTDGKPLANGNYNVIFKFYDSLVSGVPVGVANVTGVTVGGGIASAPIPVEAGWFNGQTRYLGITIAGINSGQELLPRVLVTAVPYSLATRGMAVDPRPAYDPAIDQPRPAKRVVVGSTTEEISRIAPATEALVIGTTNGAAGTTVGIYFDTASRADSAIIVEKNNAGGNEDNTMYFYVGKDGETPARKAMTITRDAHVGIGTKASVHARLVVGTTDGDLDRFENIGGVDEALVIGTAENRGAGTKAGILFDTNNRNGGGIIVEKTNDGSNEDHKMDFYVTEEGQINSHKSMTVTTGGMEVFGTARMTVCQITSDRNAKKDFRQIDNQAVLEQVSSLPLSTWSYTNSTTAVRHIGPVAQDFKAAFGLGDDDKHIATVDADGVALASIQALHAMVNQKNAEIRDLNAKLQDFDRRLQTLEGTKH